MEINFIFGNQETDDCDMNIFLIGNDYKVVCKINIYHKSQ